MNNTVANSDPSRIKDFVEKIDHLKGILAAHLPKEAFLDRTHAVTCGCSVPTYSRKKAGKAPFHTNELGRLIHLFNLGPEFTYQDFYLPLDELDAKLRLHQRGSYANDPTTELRSMLHKMADPSNPIVVKRVAHRHVGGIGGDPSLLLNPILRNGDLVTLIVPLPPRAKDGHLLVLNYSPAANGGVSFLMPSCYAPETSVGPYPLILPTKDAIDAAFPVSPPEGIRPVFALWCAEPPETFVTMPEQVDERVAQLSPAVMVQIINAIHQDAKEHGGKFLAFKGEYEVRSQAGI